MINPLFSLIGILSISIPEASSSFSGIISMALRMDDVELLDLAFGFVRGCYNQQIKKEQEAENNGEM